MRLNVSSRITVWGIAAISVITPLAALASSHSEAPGTAKDRLADDTDVYAWVAADAPQAVTFVGNWVPLLEPNSGPNFGAFDDEAIYYINVDNTGDSRKHVRFQFKFQTIRRTGATFLYNTGPVTSLDDPDLNVRQTYTLTRIEVVNGVEQETVLGTNLPVAPWFVGPVSMPDYASLAKAAVQDLAGGYRVFVGPRDDPFFVDLAAVFDLLTIRKLPGDKGKGVDGVGGYNVMTIALQAPMTKLTKDGAAPSAALANNILGIWDTAERPANRTINADGSVSVSGPEVQVSRLGMPLVNEVVIPLQDKNKFNASEPAGDVANFGAYVVDPEPARLLNLLYGISVPPAPRSDLVAVFATGVAGLNQPANVSPGEMIRLNLLIAPTASPNRFGVIAGDLAGFPNGRRLADDVVDIELRVVAGVLVDGFDIAPNNQLGDGIDANDKPFLPYFPYVAPPHNPLAHTHHPEQRGPVAVSFSEVSPWTHPRTTAGMTGGSRATLELLGGNPADASRLQYTLSRAARVSLKIYDLQGRAVRTLVDQDGAPGTFVTSWNGTDDGGRAAGKGLYFARFVVDGELSDTRKITLR